MQSGALIYMGRGKCRQRDGIQVQRDVSPLSKYSYRKGDSNQEVSRVKVSINESGIRKSSMSHVSYGKPREREKS